MAGPIQPPGSNPTTGIAGNPLTDAIGNFYIYKSDNVSLSAGLNTFTHSIGIAPARGDGIVLIVKRSTATFNIDVVSSNSMTVTIGADGATNADICVIAFHSIIR